ncbi:MAG: antitoxin [Candidatus Lokiarchaeota archaeon]|nr:antitoxin [Candidatus Lokiarchaeota archaeon]
MGQKNIPIDSSTYEFLKSLKKPGESFSELILRLIRGYNDNILRHFGGWDLDDGEMDEIQASLKYGWSRWIG